MSAIPLTLVQTGRPSFAHCPSALRWQQHQADLAYCYFDDAACRAFLAQHLSERVACAFDGLRPGAFKADLFRYAYLFVRGGVYVDLDMTPIAPLSAVLAKHATAQLLACTERPGIRGVWQGFLASVPGLTPLKWAVDRIVHHVETQYYPPDAPARGDSHASFWEPILSLTGPVLLGRALARHGAADGAADGDLENWSFLRGGDHTVGSDLAVHLLAFDDHVREQSGELLIADSAPDYAPHDSYAPLFLQRQVYAAPPLCAENAR